MDQHLSQLKWALGVQVGDRIFNLPNPAVGFIKGCASLTFDRRVYRVVSYELPLKLGFLSDC
jgi:hypothetical protein